jgi:quaternary ammonium compound-resistance protein SugE
MSWILLVCAGVLEIGWALGLKYTAGLTRFWPSVATLTCMAASVYLLALAVRDLPVGTAYAVWTGIGAVGTVIVGILFFREPCTAARLVCVALIAAGIIGLKLSAPTALETGPDPLRRADRSAP